MVVVAGFFVREVEVGIVFALIGNEGPDIGQDIIQVEVVHEDQERLRYVRIGHVQVKEQADELELVDHEEKKDSALLVDADYGHGEEQDQEEKNKAPAVELAARRLQHINFAIEIADALTEGGGVELGEPGSLVAALRAVVVAEPVALFASREALLAFAVEQ